MAKEKIRPLGSRVLIAIPTKQDTTTLTPGGVHVPDTAVGRHDRGVVVATGRGHVSPSGRLIEPEVKKGDRVVFDAYQIQYIIGQPTAANTPLAKPGDSFIIDEEHVRCVIDD